MRRALSVAFAAAVFMIAAAHVGSPNMVFDGLAGPYSIRVVVRPPDVVPGRAEVLVRVDAPDVQRVTIRPVFWRAGVKGAPAPDEIRRVPGPNQVYDGLVWLMSRGSYSVYVGVEGARGAGTAIVPVNAFATGRLPLSPALGGILLVLAALLIAGLVTLVRVAVGESMVPPGETFTPQRRRHANRVTIMAVPVLALVVFGGARWWSSVDSDYQRTMFHPPAIDQQITVDSTHRTLELQLRDTGAFRVIVTPPVRDHGKWMHLFLVSTSGMQTFAHLHPSLPKWLGFKTEVPWLPAGRYLLFGDMVQQNGTSVTVNDTIDIPKAPGAVSPSDPDDSWDRTAAITPLFANAVRILGQGYTMGWAGGDLPLVSGQPLDLRFVVRDSAGAIATLNPYLGMAGHAVVIRHDASVFIHLHPAGTVAMVSQQVFALRDVGDTNSKGEIPREALDSMSMPAMAMPATGTISFPYEFPKPGRYRIWVQVKPRDVVLTGTFDVDVR